MKIEVYNTQKNMRISSRAVKKIINAVMSLENRVCDELSVHFITTKKISELHAMYFQDSSTTDCISFPMDEHDTHTGYSILGEIFVCPETAIHYAQKHAVNPYEECTLYIVHGLLHLLGYEDVKPQLKKTMRRAEKRHMLNLKKLNLLLNK